jgi:hypothetical protein
MRHEESLYWPDTYGKIQFMRNSGSAHARNTIAARTAFSREVRRIGRKPAITLQELTSPSSAAWAQNSGDAAWPQPDIHASCICWSTLRAFRIQPSPANHRSDLCAVLARARHPRSKTRSFSNARPNMIQPGGPLLRRCPPLIVVHVEPADCLRIISARRATARERAKLTEGS